MVDRLRSSWVIPSFQCWQSEAARWSIRSLDLRLSNGRGYEGSSDDRTVPPITNPHIWRGIIGISAHTACDIKRIPSYKNTVNRPRPSFHRSFNPPTYQAKPYLMLFQAAYLPPLCISTSSSSSATSLAHPTSAILDRRGSDPTTLVQRRSANPSEYNHQS